MRTCPTCKVNLIEDIVNGEYICTKCGYVADESITSFAPESISSDLEEKLRNTRCGAPISFSIHDLGLSTEISNLNKDYNGNRIDVELIENFTNVRKWHSRIRVSSSRERRLSNVLSKISEFCSILNLPKVVNETAALLYRNYESKNKAKGKGIVGIALASIYLACKKNGVMRSIEEIVSACNICDKKTIHLIYKYCRELIMESKDSIYSYTNNVIDRYIVKIINMSKLDMKVERLALELAHKTNNPSLINGKDPTGLAAAYVYMAATLLGINMYQRDITSISNVTEVTIRNRYKEIISNHRIRLMIKCK